MGNHLQKCKSRVTFFSMSLIRFGLDLRKFREANLLSQKDLAEWMDVSLRTVQHMEHNKHLPSYRTRVKFNKVRAMVERVREIK